MNAYQWIDRVKAAKNLTSDYAAAKYLGLSQPTVITMRRRGSTLSDETAIRVADALGLNPAGVLVDQLAERSKDAAVRSTLAREVERLCILCKVKYAIDFIASHLNPSGLMV